jgi:hypothetical protein
VEGEVRVLSEKKDEALSNRASGTEDTAFLGRELRSHYGYLLYRNALNAIYNAQYNSLDAG